MNARQLGADGPWVSEIGLGGMYLSVPGRPTEDEAVNTIRAALDAGITFIDTANVYCEGARELGHNERLIAKALRGFRGKVVVGTKGGMCRPDDGWGIDGRPASLRRACEESLVALGVEAIDLYQWHRTDPDVPLEDSVGELRRLRDEGKVRWIGLSNVTVEQLERARRIVSIASVQNRWNPHDRSVEHDGVLALCSRERIAFLPYSPFAGAGGSVGLAQVGRLGEVARELGMSPHRMILAWMLAKSPVVIPIPGARRTASIVDSAAASGTLLSVDAIRSIEAAMPPSRT